MTKSIWKKCAWMCLLTAMPSVYAVDGVVLIDQSHALAGSITPGDAPGFPVTISQPGSYRLSSNLILPDANTNAIEITAEYVTLDLNGFSIIGPVVCSSDPAICPAPTQQTGISAQAASPGLPGPKGTRILNGTVKGMGATGIVLTGIGSSVEKVVASQNASGGLLVAGRVINSSAVFNGTFGVFAITVLDSTATDNHTVGIQLDGSGGVAIGNIASFNGTFGISIPNGSAFNNTIVRNGSFGVTMICPSVLNGNTIVSNSGGSIQITNTETCASVNNATRP
jgi:hypothetical protein